MRSPYYLISIAIVLFMSLRAASIMLRIRLSDGSIRRLEVDENPSLNVIKSKLLSEGIILQSEAKFKFKEEYVIEETKLLKIKPGELIEIIEEKSHIVKIIESSSTISNENITSSSSSSSSPLKSNEILKKATKKVPTSIADMKKRKLDMVKIITQKVPANRAVNIVPSAARILNRLAKFGGVAILAGRYKKEVSKSKKPKKDRHSDCTIEVLTAFEVTPKFDDNHKNLATDYPEIDKILQVTEHLNLTVVGLSIGCKASEDSLSKPPPVQEMAKYKSTRGVEKKDKEGNKESSMWKPTHVYTTLQLKSKLPTQHNDSLIIITTATTKSTGSTATRPPPAASTTKNSSPSKGSSGEEGGLLLEAYQLSDQAIELFTKNILSYQQPALSNYKDREKAKSNIFLNSEVLLKNEETLSLDPLLFAVPLPIVSVEASLNARAKTPLRSSSSSSSSAAKFKPGKVNTISSTSSPESIEVVPVSDEFDHTFPTPNELEASQKDSDIAKKYLIKLLKNLNKEDVHKKMKDPHFIMYLSKYLDPTILSLLCKFLSDKSISKLPAKLSMSFDMLKLTLDESSSLADDDEL